MKPEGYKKYKRDVEAYLQEYKKKYAPWTYLEEFIEQNEVEYKQYFERLFSILPFSIAEYGKYNK